jgi:hypothetical protein
MINRSNNNNNRRNNRNKQKMLNRKTLHLKSPRRMESQRKRRRIQIRLRIRSLTLENRLIARYRVSFRT